MHYHPARRWMGINCMGDRIDGWKAIGAYLARDRSTVIRWAGERNLPVRRVPGGKRASVYALKGELDQWMAGRTDMEESGTEPVSGRTPRVTRRHMLLAAAIVLLLLGVVLAATLRPSGSLAALPEGSPDADAYIQARQDWAARTPESLARARLSLERLTDRHPDFAPAHAALADVYLLSQEFGAMNRAHAFHRARTSAETALSLDNALADAHRAMGFIRYWADGDPKRAGAAFRRAIALAPNVAQTHFWYGNVLTDNGAYPEGLRELNIARRLEPGSVAVQTDYAWALWSAGKDEEALTLLEGLARDHPHFSAIFDCLSIVRLDRKDIHGFAADHAAYARLRGETSELKRSTGIASILSSDGDTAAWRFLLDDLIRQTRGEAVSDSRFAAFVAARIGDRDALLAILRMAEERGEKWGRNGMVARVESFVAADAALRPLLDRRRMPPG